MTPASYLLEEVVHSFLDEDDLSTEQAMILHYSGVVTDMMFTGAAFEIFVLGATYQTHPGLIMHVRPFMNPLVVVPAISYAVTKGFVAGHSAIAAAKPQHERASYWQFVSQAMTGTGPGVGGWTPY